ncbi:MAG: glycosyltransferase family 4 protein [Spirochaetia bacterium]|nr:glycosyltransferase family 4 protein [Spirochaetia bacterium]
MKKEAKQTVKKISILSQYFYPDIAATGQLLTELAEDLVKMNFDVQVVTAKPSYAAKISAKKNEIYHGIKIKRFSAALFSKNKKIGRIFNSLFFLNIVLLKLLFTKKDRLLLIVSNPPFLMAAGWVLNIFFGQKYACLVHDIYPDIAEKLGHIKPKGIISKTWRALNKLVYIRAEAVIVLSDGMKKELNSIDNIDKQKIYVLPNWADESCIYPVNQKENRFIKKNNLLNKFILLYSGNLGLFQNLENLIEAAEKYKKKDILLIFIGEGGKKDKLMKLTKDKKITNIQFLPYQKKEDLPYSLSSASISFIALEKGVETLCAPSKIYSIMASGRPFIVLSQENSEPAKIAKKSGAGFRVNQNDIEGLIEKIDFFYANRKSLNIMGKNARNYFENNYKRNMVTKKYAELLRIL